MPLKCFNCGKAAHFATKCPHDDQNIDDDQTIKYYKKKFSSRKQKFNFNNIKKKKGLFSKEDFDDEAGDSLGDEGETLFMAEIEVSKISSSNADNQLNNQLDLENCEINFEGELLCSLEEIIKQETYFLSGESSSNLTISLQNGLDDSKRVIKNLKSILADKEKETQALKQQVGSLTKQVEEHERTIHLHNMLGKQKKYYDLG